MNKEPITINEILQRCNIPDTDNNRPLGHIKDAMKMFAHHRVQEELAPVLKEVGKLKNQLGLYRRELVSVLKFFETATSLDDRELVDRVHLYADSIKRILVTKSE